MESWAEFEDLQGSWVATNCIPNGSKIYWDVRPHHAYPTIEFRFLDVCTRVDEAVCLAAILQAIVAKVWKLRRDNLIELERKRLHIPDIERLMDVAMFKPNYLHLDHEGRHLDANA